MEIDIDIKDIDVNSTLVDTKSSGGDIPLTILKGNKMFPQVLCKWMNDSLKTGDFPDPLKMVEITLIHKKEDPFDIILKNHIQPSLKQHPAVLKSIALPVLAGSWYSACTFPVARGMAKGTC